MNGLHRRRRPKPNLKAPLLNSMLRRTPRRVQVILRPAVSSLDGPVSATRVDLTLSDGRPHPDRRADGAVCDYWAGGRARRLIPVLSNARVWLG